MEGRFFEVLWRQSPFGQKSGSFFFCSAPPPFSHKAEDILRCLRGRREGKKRGRNLSFHLFGRRSIIFHCTQICPRHIRRRKICLLCHSSTREKKTLFTLSHYGFLSSFSANLRQFGTVLNALPFCFPSRVITSVGWLQNCLQNSFFL